MATQTTTTQMSPMRPVLQWKSSRRGKRGGAKRRGHRGGRKTFRLKSDRLGITHLRVMSWNCASFARRRPDIDRLIYSADIIALQETNIRGDKVNITGFQLFLNAQHRGQAFFVRECIHASPVNMDRWSSDSLQLMAIRIQQGQHSLTVVNVYACNNSLLHEQDWHFIEEVTDYFGHNIMFCGDFNAKARSWYNIHQNPQGEALENFLVRAEVVCINDNRPTRMALRDGDEDSIIDLALVSPSLVALCRWVVLGYQGSDHFPCCILVKINKASIPLRQCAFQYSNSGDDVASKARRIAMSKPKHHRRQLAQPVWWDSDIEALWNDKRNAVRSWQKARSSRGDSGVIATLKQKVQDTANIFKTHVQQKRQVQWEELCYRVGNHRSLKLFWRLFRSMTGTSSAQTMPDILGDDQSRLTSDTAKGTAFLARYIHQTDQKDTHSRSLIRESIPKGQFETTEADEFLITLDDIKNTLKRSRNTAPGPDGVRYSDLGLLSDDDLLDLCGQYNSSIATGTINDEWLHCFLVPVLKHGREPSTLSSYRVISIQNTIGKVIEKIIARKIALRLERFELLPSSLGGYRSGRDTWCNASTFAYHVYEGFHEGIETCAVVIDLEDAYNRVQFGYLIHQLLQVHIPARLVTWIASAMFRRSVVFRCGQWMSQPTIIHPGLPQGSPLSPILFNIYTIGITGNPSDGRGGTLSYADDILIYRQGRDRGQVAAEIQVELDRLSEWCSTSGALINPTKASVTWFSLNNRIVKATVPAVQAYGETIPRTERLKYLGVSFDRSLSFNAQVDLTITKARRGLAAMKVMAAARCQQRLLAILYQGLVLSMIEYALAFLTLSRSQIERLERVQNEAMRIILGCTKATPCNTMRFLLDFPTMSNRIEICRARAYLKICGDTSHPLHEALTHTKKNRLRRGQSWLGRAEAVIQQVCPLDEIQLGEEWVQVPHDMTQIFNVVITLGRQCREWSPAAVQAEVAALINENSGENDPCVFTDGSVIRFQRSAWAFTVISHGRTIMEDSGAYTSTTSSLTMEIMAVTRAMAWLHTQNFSGACILTDSMCMLRKIQNGQLRKEWIELIRTSTLQRITFVFVPGHAGVCGNERADTLAGNAAVIDGHGMDRVDIIHALRDRGRLEVDTLLNNSFSGTRVLEMGLKRGVARREQHLSDRGRVINQVRTGVISVHSLGVLLRMGSERLWTCPVCNEDNP